MGWAVQVDADAVLRAQGADPVRLRARSARAAAVAELALEEGLALVEPRVLVERLPVTDVRHERVSLGGARPGRLAGPLVAQHLAAAGEVAVIVCTVGPALEELASSLMRSDPARAVALDAVGSAAVESLAAQAVVLVEEQAAAAGLCTSLPVNPGLLGWPLDPGQRDLFALVDAASIGVALTDSLLMLPHKSRSLVVGVGEHVAREGEICDYCALRETCRHRPLGAGHAAHTGIPQTPG